MYCVYMTLYLVGGERVVLMFNHILLLKIAYTDEGNNNT